MNATDAAQLRSLDLSQETVQTVLGGWLANWIRDRTGLEAGEHGPGVLAHYADGRPLAQLALGDAKVRRDLAAYLRRWLKNAELVTSKKAVLRQLDDFVTVVTTRFDLIEAVVDRILREELH
jgi:hypothetical protein